MTALIEYASLTCVAAGVASGALALAVGRDPRMALRVALDLWLAAGLLRLMLAAGWEELLAAAAVVAVRQIVGVALHHTWSDDGGRPTMPTSDAPAGHP